MLPETNAGQDELKRKTVFISYSWSSKDWVLDFAEELQGTYGIKVVIDDWVLNDGDDLNAFMEREVSDPSIDKVLMICDKQYMEKADAREGEPELRHKYLVPNCTKRMHQVNIFRLLIC